jgi:hypothetical protein
VTPRVPPDDSEREPLSGEFIQPFYVAIAALLAGGLALFGVGIVTHGGPDAVLGWMVLVLPAGGALIGWRWAAPLRKVVATRTGLIVSSAGKELFVPYAAVAKVREKRLSSSHVITVELREPVGGLRRFALIPRYLPSVGPFEHPTAAKLTRRVAEAAKP